MSALPVAFPEISDAAISATQTHRSAGADAGTCSTTSPTSKPANWELTDRGIAVVMLIAAVILTAALAVIGITAVRVTSAGYDAGVPALQQVHR
jgi:hypothetical protein